MSCAAFNLVFDIFPHPPPEFWPGEEVWPPMPRVYRGHKISVDDIYKAIKDYKNGFDEWPICSSCETIDCAAFDLVFGIVSHDQPAFWPDEDWPPRARVYEGHNITAYDMYRAINVYRHGRHNGNMPICRGISCETINCTTISCAAFNHLVFDILPYRITTGRPYSQQYPKLKESPAFIWGYNPPIPDPGISGECTIIGPPRERPPPILLPASIVAMDYVRTCPKCHVKTSDGKCTWSRSVCTHAPNRKRVRRIKPVS